MLEDLKSHGKKSGLKLWSINYLKIEIKMTKLTFSKNKSEYSMADKLKGPNTRIHHNERLEWLMAEHMER